MNHIMNFGSSLALSTCLYKAGTWLVQKGDSIVDQGIRQSNALIEHICHGCDLNRFSPDLNKVRSIIDQSPLYTHQAAEGFKAILADATTTEQVGEGISNMGLICVAAGTALGLYAAAKLVNKVVDYLKS